jgi:hypothetical protein
MHESTNMAAQGAPETCTTAAQQMHPNKIGPIRSVSAPRRARPSQLPSFFHGLSLKRVYCKGN